MCVFDEIIHLFFLIVSNYLHTFDFAVMTIMRADTSTDLVSEGDDVVVGSEQRREDR